MRIKELIQKLQEFDQDAHVIGVDEFGRFAELNNIYEVMVCVDAKDTNEILYDLANEAVTMIPEDYEEGDHYDEDFSKNNPDVKWEKAIVMNSVL